MSINLKNKILIAILLASASTMPIASERNDQTTTTTTTTTTSTTSTPIIPTVERPEPTWFLLGPVESQAPVQVETPGQAHGKSKEEVKAEILELTKLPIEIMVTKNPMDENTWKNIVDYMYNGSNSRVLCQQN